MLSDGTKPEDTSRRSVLVVFLSGIRIAFNFVATEILPRAFGSLVLIALLALVFSGYGSGLGVPNLFRDVEGVHNAVFAQSTLSSPTAWAHVLMSFSAGLAALIPLFDWFYAKDDQDRFHIASRAVWRTLIIVGVCIYILLFLIWAGADDSKFQDWEILRALIGAAIGVFAFWVALFTALLWMNLSEDAPADPDNPDPLTVGVEWMDRYLKLPATVLRMALTFLNRVPRAIRKVMRTISTDPRDVAVSLFFAPLIILMVAILSYNRLLPGVALVGLVLLVHLLLRWMRSISPPARLVVLICIGFLFYFTFSQSSTDGYKLTFDGIEGPSGDLYDVPLSDIYNVEKVSEQEAQSLFDACGPGQHGGGRVKVEQAMNNWLTHAKRVQGVDRPKLVIVATSGGAYRASFWTAIVLDELNKLDAEGPLKGFASSIRFITGASGGMVAGAYQAALATQEGWPKGVNGAPVSIIDKLTADIADAQKPDSTRPSDSNVHYHVAANPFPRDSLSAVSRQMIRADIPSLFLIGQETTDRGKVLEKHWGSVDAPFSTFRAGEKAGWRPSILFSPMLIESGKPLLISNLDLGIMPAVEKGEMVEFFRVYPCSLNSFSMATAVRMNATFPYISPAISLPTQPRQRVVDAGYYDNYGISLLKALLASDSEACQQETPDASDFCMTHWLNHNTSGIVLVEIRAFDLDTNTEPNKHCKDDEPDLPDRGGALEFFTSPIEAMLRARAQTMVFRNEQALRQYEQHEDGLPLHRIVLSNCLTVGMNWIVPLDELHLMQGHFSDLWAREEQFNWRDPDGPGNAEAQNLTARDWLIKVWSDRPDVPDFD